MNEQHYQVIVFGLLGGKLINNLRLLIIFLSVYGKYEMMVGESVEDVHVVKLWGVATYSCSPASSKSTFSK